MSLFSSLYVAGVSDPAVVLSALRLEDSERTGLSAVAAPVKRPHFLDEEYGIDPAVAVHFTLDKGRSAHARESLARVVREYLARTTDDVLLMYLDFPVVRRIGQLREVAHGYEEFVSAEGGWTPMSSSASS